MTQGDQSSSLIDSTVASVARVYDAMLDGKDNYAVDRTVADDLKHACPEIPLMARDNRDWLIRIVRFLVDTQHGPGLTQILDCGSGLPTAENTHQAAQRLNPDAQVVYVDNDPVVAAHGRALLEENNHTHFAAADLTQAQELLRDPNVIAHLDLDEPLALLLVGVLHHVDDQQDPWELVRTYRDLLPSGSYLAISHFYDPDDDTELAQLAKHLQHVLQTSSSESGLFRTRSQIHTLFDGLELVEPGLVRIADWWPDGPRTNDLLAPQQLILGALARTP